RALDLETTVGKSCVPDEIRGTRLYNSVISSRMPSFKERLSLIEESGEVVPNMWELSIPF
ncbi:MAG: hypothetical protein VX502_01450, partial [Candidatus Thermoplasmatota archaeon]|nr:hypothetical protein [Candidatus Thermoplasmatota archaeon]